MAYRAEYGEYDNVPNRTTLRTEMERIGTRQQLQTRIDQLKRIRRDDQQQPVDYHGLEIPRWQAEELARLEKRERETRQELRDLMDYENMDEVEKATARARGNIGDLKGAYRTADELDELTSMYYAESDAGLMKNYIETWKQYCVVKEYEEEVIENIQWLMENRPDTLRRILERGYSQATIEYVYPTSADMTPLIVRHNNIVAFWREAVQGKY